MSGSGSEPLVPTFKGYVQNSMDGLVLFEACLSGKLHHVPRRPHDRERSSLIKSGNIFIYEENASGIKRWTDGVAWSPSRILGNFLLYRELEKPFPPGEKKRAMKRKRSSQIDGATDRRDSEEEPAEVVPIPPTPPSPKPAPESMNTDSSGQDNDRELDRQLIGSLVDSYGFRPDGLVKKTMSIAINGVSHHLVSYYKVDEVKNRLLTRPLNDPRLAGITVRPDLYLKQNFRTPVEDTEHYVVDPTNMHAHPGLTYGNAMMSPYGMRPGQYMQQPGYPMYAMPATSTPMYAASPAAAWPPQQQQQQQQQQHSGMQPGYNHNYAASPYGDYYNRQQVSSTPQSATMKTEDQSSTPGSYTGFTNPNPFQNRSQSGSFSAVSPSYQSSSRPQSSAYGLSAQNHTSPSLQSSNPPQQYSRTPSQSHNYDPKMSSHYPGQPHSQGYPPVHSHPTSGPGAPPTIRSPQPAGTGISPLVGSAPHAQQLGTPMQYRQNSYPSQTSGGHVPDVSGLGINSSYATSAAPPSASYPAGSYTGYNPHPHQQGYRSSVDGGSAVPNGSSY